MNILIQTLFFFALGLECTPGVNETAIQQDILQQIDEQYSSVNSLSARFTQNSYFVGLDEQQESQGQLKFLKPGKMHWSYGSPLKQDFISDGATVWLYEPRDNQVTIANFSQSFNSDIPVSFLLGIGTLADSFNVKNVCKDGASLILRLEPKQADASLRAFSLRVRSEDLIPEGVRVIDIGGNETTITLEGIVLNPPLQNALFEFVIPKGTDVIDRRDLTS